jgi:DNA-binding response OmpR family regulator
MPEPIDILLVDDEARNLDALEAILSDPAYRLIRAQDADRALRLLLENDVAAIVLDIKMPGVSGLELAQMIKNTKRFRQTPIVFLTAYLMDDQHVIAGYDAGAVDYLTKPVNPQILRHKIAVFAELFRKTRELAELNATLEGRVPGDPGARAAEPAGAAALGAGPFAAADGPRRDGRPDPGRDEPAAGPHGPAHRRPAGHLSHQPGRA